MAISQLLPRQNRSGTLTFGPVAVPANWIGRQVRLLLDTTESLHNNPAESVAFDVDLSFDGGATWVDVATGPAWPGGPVGLGKDGTPAQRALSLTLAVDGQGREPTHARATYTVVGTVNFGVQLETI